MRNRALTFDPLESRKLLSGTQVDPNYDLDSGWIPDPSYVDPSLGAVPIIHYTPTIVYPAGGPAPYDVGAGGTNPY